MRDIYTKHVRSYMLLRRLFVPLLCFVFNLKSVMLPEGLQTPCLIVANHNTDLDPVLVAASCREHMYFVASEHVLRSGLGAWLLRRIFAPISRQKGTTDATAAMAILRKLRGGANVCLFAEGNRSFNGLTGSVFPATGKMVKAAGCALVTFRLEGGYFTTPRWGCSLRRGLMKGYPVRIFTPDKLKEMTPDEINGVIAEDTFEDAYARQEKEHISFKGKRLAEKLETAFFICPKCGRIGRMKSKNDTVSCACGMSARYDEQGFLHGDIPFTTLSDWDEWQQKRLPEHVTGLEKICGDMKAALYDIAGKGEKPLYEGAISLYPHKISIAEIEIPVSEIPDMALVGRNRIIFTWNNGHYEINGDKDFCGRKYLLFYRLLSQREM